jgi:preprotein translocase subunit SecE
VAGAGWLAVNEVCGTFYERIVTVFHRLITSIREFIEGVRGELKKVSFPTRAETIGATTVVIVFCILMSLYLSMMDSVLGWLMRKVI